MDETKINMSGDMPLCTFKTDGVACGQLGEWKNVTVANAADSVLCDRHMQQDAAFWIDGWGADVGYRRLSDGMGCKVSAKAED